MKNPYQVTQDFESALCEYTGAPFAVAVNSCTAALTLACEWFFSRNPASAVVEIPKHTYVSVPQAIMRAGGRVKFADCGWRGAYQLYPLPVYDCARRFTSGMYVLGQFQCLSFAASKILGLEQGGAILHHSANADKWFRRMRFDGRTPLVDPLEDSFDLIGHHCIMTPSVAASLLVRLHHLARHNEDMPDYPYPDLSKHPAFK